MNDVSLGKLTLMIGALVTLIFSLLPWYSASIGGYGYSRNAWQSGMFPMATWAPLLALVAGAIVAVEAFNFVKLPEKIWEFTVDQIVIVLAVFSFLICASYVLIDKGGASIGFGLILCVLGTLAMIAGFVMDQMNIGSNPNAQNPTIPFEQPGFPSPQQSQAPQAPEPPTGPTAF